MITEIILTRHIPKTQQFIYGLDVTFYNPYKIYINNILIAEDDAGAGQLIDLRPWLLKNGTYTITLKLTPFKNNKYLDLSEDLVDRLSFIKFLEDANDNLDKNTLVEHHLPLVTTKNMPYLEQSWDIEVKDLPYELEGWSNGQDLSKWDKEVLQKKVVTYYDKLRTILNDGDAEAWIKYTKKRRQETNVFNYQYDKQKNREKFKKNSRKL